MTARCTIPPYVTDRSDELTEQDEVSVPLFRGSEDEVLAKLWTLCYSGADDNETYAAVAQILDGSRFARCAGERFEVVAPEWSIVQDVYGCERGRDCTEPTPAQRTAFEARIADLEAGD